MTGYQSKRAAAQDKYRAVKTYHEGKPVYVAQPAQEPVCPACKAEVLYECVACSSNNYPAQPAQEPASVTYKEVQDSMNALEKGTLYQQVIAEELGQRKLYTRKLYTHPPQRTWVGLTYEDMVGLQKELFDKNGEMVLPTSFAMAVEAKLKEKNT